MLIFEKAACHTDPIPTPVKTLPKKYIRQTPPALPDLSELEVVRHYTALSQKNFSIDTHMYPLGSCTMKYNPRSAHRCASFAGFTQAHPLEDPSTHQGTMACLYDLQDILLEITGMDDITLSPMAGAQGEFTGVSLIKAYHAARGESHRNEFLIPDCAHGTNPASAAMCGFTIKEVATAEDGDIDLEALKAALSDKTAGIMLTNPSTLGLFERQIDTVASMVHEVGGLLYYDGANLNAIMGVVRPGDMGFDVMHLNLHKTFATPHGGGGPGAGPVAVKSHLAPYLPLPIVTQSKSGDYSWLTEQDRPQSMGRLSTFHGNVGILLRAYVYARCLGTEGMHRVAEYATLNANYLLKCLTDIGYIAPYPERLASHEFVLTLAKAYKQQGVSALDVAKLLLDHGIHAPTMYFPLLVPECLLIEPTETESKRSCDDFIAAMESIFELIQSSPENCKKAPLLQTIQRADETQAAKNLNIKWKPDHEKINVD